MKRVLLVNTNTERMPYPVPPLGLCMLAGVLEKKYKVRIYDGVFDEGRGLQGVIRDFIPDYIGFSIRNIDDVVADRPVFYPDRIVSDFIRPAMSVSDAVMILGGSGFSIFPEEMMEFTGAHYGISGEGERVLPALLQMIDTGEDPAGLPGLYGRPGGPAVRMRSPANDTVPMAGHALIDCRIDFDPYRQRGVYSIQTKRGCALGCIYCTYPGIEGMRYRLREAGDIVREIRDARERLGDVMFEFVDSTFNEPSGHAEAICEAIIRERVRIRIRTMGINPRNTSRRLFALMKEAGFTQIDATPDSASPVVIRNLRKGFTRAQIRRTALFIREFDMPTMWFFLFGGPGETETTVAETLEFIDRYISPDDLVYLSQGLRIYPGTPLQRIALKEGMITAGESLFRPSKFYFSPLIGRERLNECLTAAAAVRLNCIPAAMTQPPPAMIREAVARREQEGLTEPMFRTLLRIRREWKSSGRLDQ